MWGSRIIHTSISNEDLNCVCIFSAIGLSGTFLFGVSFGIIVASFAKIIFKWVQSNMSGSWFERPIKLIQKFGYNSTSDLSLDSEDEGYRLLEGAISLFTTNMKEDRRYSKVVNYLSPEEMLSKLFSTEKSMSMALKDKANVEQMVECFQNIQEYSVNTNHPFFFNQLFGALDPVALAAELIALGLNTSSYTYETAPVFTLIEKEVFKNLGHLVFGGNGSQQRNNDNDDDHSCRYDGLMQPGGSLSNLTALHVARYYVTRNLRSINAIPRGSTKFEDEKKDQHTENTIDLSQAPINPQSKLIAFISSEAHYSFKKAVSVTGIGTDNLIIVPTLANGQMDVTKLDELMTEVGNQNGCIPFFVSATSGSTVRGSFDDIEAIVRVCRKHEDRMNHQHSHQHQHGVAKPKHKIWVHVDGAWGGSAIFSSRKDMQSLLKGVRDVDSFTFNPHKMLGAPMQTSAFITRHEGILKEANSSGAKYLFDTRKHGAEYDLGDGSYTCGRRTDAIKLWALWKYHGRDGIGRLLEQKVDSLKCLTQKIRQNDKFMLACQSWSFNVNFFYIPGRIRKRLLECGVDLELESPVIPQDISKELADISVKLKLRLHQSGEMLIPYQPISNQEADCFRLVLAGYKQFSEDDVCNVLELLDKYGHDL